MAKKYSYIVTEGPQDIEFLIRLLKHKYKSYGLSRVTQLSLLDPFWNSLVPTKYPPNGDLMKCVAVPIFLQNNEISIALHSANGIDRLAKLIKDSLFMLPAKVFGVGIILDADNTDETPQQRFNKLTNKLTSLGLNLPSVLGKVTKDSPRCGIFILPDNSSSGTLEDILLECAKINYPDLLNLSSNYINNINKTQLTKNDLRELNKPAGKNKAVVSGISSVLKPGKTLQVSLQDNRWLDSQTLDLKSVNLVKSFLAEVIGLT